MIPSELNLRGELLKHFDAEATFPRNIELAAMLTLPISIISVGRLSVSEVHSALARRSIAIDCGISSRRLRGCLVAYAGHGLVFVEGLDSPAERRFTIAHECAHFLVDYIEPREKAAAALGLGILSVLDGRRPATSDERVDGTLAGVASGPHVHTMRRDPAVFTGIDEVNADRLAFELLAPPSMILAEPEVCARWDRRQSTEDVLVERYEFPRNAARAYASMLHDFPDARSVRVEFGL